MALSGSISDLQVKMWRKKLAKDIADMNYFAQSGMVGADENNIIQSLDELKKSPGDTITVPFTAKLSGDGVVGDAELEGNEEEINPYSDKVEIDMIRNAVRLKGKYDEQRNVYDMFSDAKDKLSIWGQEFTERQAFLKLAGINVLDLEDMNGKVYSANSTFANTGNPVPNADELAGTGSRYICADASGLEAMAASDILTVSIIRQAKAKAKLASPKVKPLRIKGKDYYVMFIHPHQALDLKGTTAYNNAVKDAWWRGDQNPIFTGALAVIDGVILVEHEYVPSIEGDGVIVFTVGHTSYPVDGVRAFRSLLCGQQALVVANTKDSWTMVEEDKDYKNKKGIATGFIGGIQKLTFNSKDYGVITVDTGATIYQEVI